MMEDIYDVVAIGAGPANLSLAALAEPIKSTSLAVFDSGNTFSWHPGMMLPDARLQISPLKDLVTLVDPTSRFTFLNFLAKHGRLYRSILAHRDGVHRWEFAQYYAWVASQLPNVHFGVHVLSVEHSKDLFLVHTSAGCTRSRHIVLGIGQDPWIPEFTRPFMGRRVFHATDYLSNARDLMHHNVLLVGGGQSSAEIALHLLGHDDKTPRSLTWFGGRNGLRPMDDSPFANEWFHPQYARFFQSLDTEAKPRLLLDQLLASDGVGEQQLSALYRRLYALDYLNGGGSLRYAVHKSCSLIDLKHRDDTYVAKGQFGETGETFAVFADVVILATGYRQTIPRLLWPLRERLQVDDGRYRISASYELAWDGPSSNRIFVQNGARHSHGIADPNLSLAAWRSAVIINEILGDPLYEVRNSDITITLRPTVEKRCPDTGIAPPIEE